MTTSPLLVWHRADGTSTEFALDKESLLVGRGEHVDIRIDEPLVSREHARLERRKAGFRVFDLGSTNLTKVNGEPVRQRFLSDGDELHFARARCVFHESTSALEETGCAPEEADVVQLATGAVPERKDEDPAPPE